MVVAEFGLMEHAVRVSTDEPPPAWWARVEHFGVQRRCSILFRQALTAKQQRKIAEGRAKQLHNMTIASLSEQTGHTEAFLLGLLCRLHSTLPRK